MSLQRFDMCLCVIHNWSKIEKLWLNCGQSSQKYAVKSNFLICTKTLQKYKIKILLIHIMLADIYELNLL